MSELCKLVHYIQRADLNAISSLLQEGKFLRRRLKVKIDSDWPFSFFSPLGLAVFYDKPLVVDLLLKHGANTNSRESLHFKYSKEDMTVLCMTCKHNKPNAAEILRSLLSAKARVDVPIFLRHEEEEEEGGSVVYNSDLTSKSFVETPMVWLLQRGLWNLIEPLLDFGTDPLYLYTTTRHNPEEHSEYITSWVTTFKDVSSILRLISEGGVVPEESTRISINTLILEDLYSVIDKDFFVVLDMLLNTTFPLHKCVPLLIMYHRFAFEINEDVSGSVEEEQKEIYQVHFKHLWQKCHSKGTGENVAQFDHGHRSFLREQFYGTEDLDAVEMYHFFKKFYWRYSQPARLASLCRMCVRNRLGRIQVRKKVHSLTLPSALKRYLLYLD